MGQTLTYIDIDASGHHGLYITDFLAACRKAGCEFKLSFWISRQLTENHPALLAKFAESKATVNYVEESEFGGKITAQNELNFQFIKYSTELDEASVCFVDVFDYIMTKSIFVRPGYLKAKLVGLLFYPALHYHKFPNHIKEHYPPTLKGWCLQYLQAYLASQRSFISSIVCSDPYAPSYYNKILGTGKFKYIPDAKIDYRCGGQDARLRFIEGKRVFCFVGVIAEHKGIRQFLTAAGEALQEKGEITESCQFVIAGKSAGKEIKNELDAFAKRFPENVVVLDRWLGDDEIWQIIDKAELVCIPYLKFSGTSSFLFYAADNGKLLLAPKFGLLGELVRRYGLGVVCESASPASIKEALYETLERLKKGGEPLPTESYRKFSREFFAKSFGETLLETINEAFEK